LIPLQVPGPLGVPAAEIEYCARAAGAARDSASSAARHAVRAISG
jgi:hypothetical protein